MVDDLPVGLIARTASGTGWTCEVSDETVACSRTDALAPGASYPSITLTADVAPELPLGIHLDQHGHGLGRWRRQPGEQHGRRLRRPVALHATFCGRRTRASSRRILGSSTPAPRARRTCPFGSSRNIAPPSGHCSSCWLRWRGRRSTSTPPAPAARAVSTMIESDQPVAATRQMTWGDPVYGSTLESGIVEDVTDVVLRRGRDQRLHLVLSAREPRRHAGDRDADTPVRRGRGTDCAPGRRATLRARHHPRERRAGTLACRASRPSSHRTCRSSPSGRCI